MKVSKSFIAVLSWLAWYNDAHAELNTAMLEALTETIVANLQHL